MVIPFPENKDIFERVKASGFNRSKTAPYYNIDPASMVESRELSRSSNMSLFFGIGIICFLFILLMPLMQILAIPTNNVTAEVQWESIHANTPFLVTISVTHDAQDKIDSATFTANNKKINPVFVKSVKISPSSPLEISIYNLEMPGLPQGLQTLPVFAVKIKDAIYSSIPTGFEVKANVATIPETQSEVRQLKLEPVYTGTEPLYPGQRFFLGYRYLFNVNVDLSNEVVPLLEAKGFKKLGDKQIDNSSTGGMSVTQILQKVEAAAPGTYEFPPSQIMGYSYTLNAAQQKLYDKTPLTASLPAYQIKVIPFPEEGKPASFSGAMGSDYTVKASLSGPNQVGVGDRIKLLLTISGKGDLEQIKAPDLCCQPGFSGFFKTSDLPPETKLEKDSKSFLIDLFINSPDILNIPPIEFSYFDSQLKQYVKKYTEEIPLKVTRSKAAPLPKESSPLENSPEQASLMAPISSLISWSMPTGLIALFALGLLVLFAHYKNWRVFGIASAGIVLVLGLVLLSRDEDPALEKANLLFAKGLQEQDTYMRNKAFNEVIEVLLKDPQDSIGKELLLAKSLVQLRQYPLALFHALEAYREDPGRLELKQVVEEIIRVGGLPAKVPERFLFGPKPAWIACTFLAACAVLFFWLIAKNQWIKRILLAAFALLFLGLMGLIVVAYRVPILGVLIHSETLFQQPSPKSPLVMKAPLQEGEIVSILNISDNGEWLKISMKDGVMGYLPENALRVVGEGTAVIQDVPSD